MYTARFEGFESPDVSYAAWRIRQGDLVKGGGDRPPPGRPGTPRDASPEVLPREDTGCERVVYGQGRDG